MLSAAGIGTVLQILMVVVGHFAPALPGGIAGVLGSLVSTALGDVPLGNIAIAGGSTLGTGAMGAALSALGKR